MMESSLIDELEKDYYTIFLYLRDVLIYEFKGHFYLNIGYIIFYSILMDKEHNNLTPILPNIFYNLCCLNESMVA